MIPSRVDTSVQSARGLGFCSERDCPHAARVFIGSRRYCDRDGIKAYAAVLRRAIFRGERFLEEVV